VAVAIGQGLSEEEEKFLEPDRLFEHWQDEGDFHFVYEGLSGLETDPERVAFFKEMGDIERRHQQVFADLLEKAGVTLPPFRPSLKARLWVLVGKSFGAKTLLPMLIRSEGQEMQEYLRESINAEGEKHTVVGQMARESGEHAERLMQFSEQTDEPWHHVSSGGFLRSVVYGFNDGLTANFGLVMGVIGARVEHNFILISGLAGMIADALSMGSSSFLAAKSEQEVYANEIRMEREEIELMPEIETEELAMTYRLRGMKPAAAHSRAGAVMRDKAQALEEKVQTELGLNPRQSTSALREGWITGLATAVGALIPITPFLFLKGTAAIVFSFVMSMSSHFLVGAGRSIFTGRGVFRSGMDMFLVGLGVAFVGYLFGDFFIKLFF